MVIYGIQGNFYTHFILAPLSAIRSGQIQNWKHFIDIYRYLLRTSLHFLCLGNLKQPETLSSMYVRKDAMMKNKAVPLVILSWLWVILCSSGLSSHLLILMYGSRPRQLSSDQCLDFPFSRRKLRLPWLVESMMNLAANRWEIPALSSAALNSLTVAGMSTKS